MKYTIAYCQMQLRRAESAHQRAARSGDAAAYERTSDQVGKWEYNLRIARGASEKSAMNAVFGPSPSNTTFIR